MAILSVIAVLVLIFRVGYTVFEEDDLYLPEIHGVKTTNSNNRVLRDEVLSDMDLMDFSELIIEGDSLIREFYDITVR